MLLLATVSSKQPRRKRERGRGSQQFRPKRFSQVTRATLALDEAGVSYSVHTYDEGPMADRFRCAIGGDRVVHALQPTGTGAQGGSAEVTSRCRWRDCPAECRPHTTVYNRFDRWSRRGFWKAMLAALAKAG
jgi:hypothetical protein